MGQRVAVVLITFNSARFLPACLAGIAAQREVETELVVVDNNSSDESVAAVRRLAPAAQVILHHENRGYCAAANRGIEATSADFVLLLNPDVRLDPAYAGTLASALDAMGPEFGSATGKLLRGRGDEITPTSMVDSLGIRMTRTGRHLDIGSGEADRSHLVRREVFGVSGAAALHRRRFLEDAAVGGEVLDESFFAYREDADLAWRGRLLGWKSLLEPSAVAWHVRTVTPERRRAIPPEINMHSVKNRFLLRLKNQGAGLALRNLPFEVPRDLAVIGAALTVERSSLPALSWLWQHREEVLEKRREIQSRRRVPDRELARWFGESA
jgi:GT2 family glycosyltransferase